MHIESVLAQIEQLPPDWHRAGPLSMHCLKTIVKHVGNDLILRSIETGSGASTLLLSHLSKKHTVFSLDAGTNSLHGVETSAILNKDSIEFIIGPSQRTLPAYVFTEPVHFALIDGPHGFPFPCLDYYYIYPNLAAGALLVLDDIWIPTIHHLFEFLAVDEMFKLVEVIEDKTAFFRRSDSPAFDPYCDGWWLQKFNKEHFPVGLPKEEAQRMRKLVFG